MDTSNHAKTGAQIVYFSHGGGPLPILGDASHQVERLPGALSSFDNIIQLSVT